MKGKKLIVATLFFIGAVIAVLVWRMPKSDYQRHVAKFYKVNTAKVENMLSDSNDFLLYIGRETCPTCVEFVPALAKVSNEKRIPVYYLDSSNTEKDAKLKNFRDKYNIMFVPSLMVYVNGEVRFPEVATDPAKLSQSLIAIGFLND